MEQVFKVGFINSTKQLIDCALSVAAKLGIRMATSLAGLDAAVPAGLRMEQEGVEVIISRRGTASLLRKNLKIPILSVRISFPDIFLNIRDASLMGRKILLTSFGEEKIEGVDLLQEFDGRLNGYQALALVSAGEVVDDWTVWRDGRASSVTWISCDFPSRRIVKSTF